MDEAKLEQLRIRYADREVFTDGDDPVFVEAARRVQSPDGRRSLPYAGIATLLGLPAAPNATGLDVALIGVPMDLGVSNRPGARFGPRAVRSIERIGPYHPTFRGVPKSAVRAADVGDVPFRSRYSLEQSLEDIEHYYAALTAQGVRPLSVGGDHSITYPILKALGKKAPVG
ncbi:MAG: arginase family protein, partial [Steroidobacteraceae bacterium]